MSDSLDEYRRKRDFTATREPSGAEPGPKSRKSPKQSAQELLYCIQKHDARRLHYDLRLELDGVLKSWAVPKGPSLDPQSRRLAVHVEDHPLDYALFEGAIPEGQYGAGAMIVWDRGIWIPEGDPAEAYKKGRLKFELRGEKLSGSWNLVRSRMEGGKEQWFLLKSKDEAARSETEYNVTEALPDSVLSAKTLAPPRPKANKESRAGTVKTPAPKRRRKTAAPSLSGARKAALPETLEPQLATLVETVPDGDWRYEVKFDGYRILARIDNGEVRLISRNGLDWTARMPQQAEALASLALESAWLDGEVAVPDENGLPEFQALQNAFNDGQSGNIMYYLFDVPFLDGKDLRQVPLEQRRAALLALLEKSDSDLIRYSADFAESGEAMLNSACELQMEGLIGKRAGSPYTSGRSKDWIKLKCAHRHEFVVVGFTEPKNSRSYFGALVLGLHDKPGGTLRYAGKVGTGFNARTLGTVYKKIQPLEVSKPAVINPPTGAQARGIHWLEPVLLAEVGYAQMTHDGIVRQAVFHGLREDKPAEEITRERPEPVKAVEKKRPSRKSTAQSQPAPEQALSNITHPDRVIDPTSGTTKLQLARFYGTIASKIQPHLHERPVALVRAPDGVEGELFFQKNAEKLAIPGVTRLEKAYKSQPAMILDTSEALLGAVQMNTVELHTWNATSGDLDHPDRFVLDLDPDPTLPWARMVEATQLTVTMLDELGLRSFLKTSGGKGIHIVVPLVPAADWDSIKAFSRALVKHMAKLLPDRFSAVSGPRNRVGRIFIDYLRNSRGATTICAYAARARPGLAVSVPIAREELETLTGADVWTIHNLDERLAQLKSDPWQDYADIKQTITADMRERLGMR